MGGSVTVDIDDVLRGFDALKARARDLSPLLEEIKPLLRRDLDQHFGSAEGPEGGWAPRAPGTIKNILSSGPAGAWSKRGRRRNVTARGKIKKRAQKRLDNPLGKLKNAGAWKWTVRRQELEGESRVDWSLVHQEGGTAGHGAKIPARPFAWASDALVEHFADRLEVFLVEAF